MDENALFSPFKINRFTLKNRIGVAPMTRISSPGDSIPRKDVLDFLVRRAENDVAVIYTEAIVTDYESAQGYPNQSRMTTQRQIDAWRPVVRAIQDAGSVAVMQMFHCGRMAWPEINPAGRVIAPSPVTAKQDNPLTGQPYSVPDEMSLFDIGHVVCGFVETAKGAVEAGFDGIEIHGAHGYLINQFLSAYSNRRMDAYGGSVENRFRFAKEVIQAVRPVVPDDRILIFRISNWGVADAAVSLFENTAEWQQVITSLDKEPIDAISVSTMNYKDRAFETDKNMAQVTREVTDKPIMICGNIYDRATADDALTDADIILSGKSLLLNPKWVADIRENRALDPVSQKESDRAYTGEALP